MKNIITFSLLVIFLSLISSLSLSINESYSEISNIKKFIPPSKHIKKITFGHDEIIADSLWLRWIQNVDACGKGLSERDNIILEADLEGGDLSNRYKTLQKNMVCDQGWSFRMLDAVTDLSPKFRIPYLVGASNLSVIAEDHIGAKRIFEKGAKEFPNDWRLWYQGAYHFLYELNDLKTAAVWLKQAADNGAPDWLYSLSSRVHTDSGQIELGIKRLYDYLKNQTDPKVINSIKNRIKKLKEK